MYPPDANKPNGKLRLMCEANPLAFLAEQGDRLPLGGIHDVRQGAGRAALGAILELEELRNIAATMKSARILGSFMRNFLVCEVGKIKMHKFAGSV